MARLRLPAMVRRRAGHERPRGVVGSSRPASGASTGLLALARLDGSDAPQPSRRRRPPRARAAARSREPAELGAAGKFCIVGASGYVVNLAVYTRCSSRRRHPLPARGRLLVPRRGRRTTTCGTASGRSAQQRGHFAYQGLRFLVVSALALAREPAFLDGARRAGSGRSSRRRSRSSLVTPLNFVGNKLWSFRQRRLTRLLLRACGRSRSRPRPRRARRRPTSTTATHAAVQPPVAPRRAPKLTKSARPRSSSPPEGRDWLERYPPKGRTTRGDLRQDDGQLDGEGLVGPGRRDRDGQGRRRDGHVTEAWTGPQVAWKMARGYDGAFGGTEINTPAGLARRSAPSSWSGSPTCAGRSRCGTSTCSRCSRSRVSLWYFNHGDVFTSVPLVYPPLVYLLGRAALGRRARPAAGAVAAGLAGLAARRGDGLPGGLPDRAQRRATRT